ncbi:MAG TPA: FAD-dependent monooxygenase [Thermomicrobiales bacterium]|nr:FAD-dependent monooxygenase [Thermomicrobiales bacterium]
MYDAIVIGARCAGAPTAMLLARGGYRVLLLDRASFPSDTMRGHFIHHPGVVALHRWGLLPRVIASGCPPIRVRLSDLGDFPLAIPAEVGDGVDANYAPRRFALDAILVEAAGAAGAEVREHFTVHDLAWDAGRVVGIRGRASGGATVQERARIVVGADGAHSVVARAVRAREYRARPALTFAYYSYFSGVPLGGIEVYLRPEESVHITFPTNHGLACIALQAPVAGFHAFRADIGGNFFRALDRVPHLAERVRAGRREERWYGTADVANFVRTPYGPGWALVGDAGYHKDPVTAQGITDAFRDAALLAEAVDAGFSGRAPLQGALADYERRRNAAALPAYAEACRAATLAAAPPDVLARRAALRPLAAASA